MDQTKKVKTKKRKKGLRPKISQILVVVSKFLRFSTKSEMKTKTKRSSSQNLNEIQRKFTKTTKTQFLRTNSRAVNTNLGILGLDLHFSSLEPVNFFGTQSSFGRARPRNAPPWRRAWLKVIRSCFGISLITLCDIFIVVCVLIRITNKNERLSIKVLKMKKKRMLHCVHSVSNRGRVKSKHNKNGFPA